MVSLFFFLYHLSALLTLSTETLPAPAPRALAAIAVDPMTMIMYLYGGYNYSNWFQGLTCPDSLLFALFQRPDLNVDPSLFKPDFWSLDLSVVQYPGTKAKWVFIGDEMGPPELCGMSLVSQQQSLLPNGN